MQIAAALTILTSDPAGGPEPAAVFLKTWLRHYERQITRDHCYIICADAPSELLDLAQGCSVIRLPPGSGDTLVRRRGRAMANMVAALGQYYTHVIVGEPHELLLADPAIGDLNDLLGAIDGGQILTPLGLELIQQDLAEDNQGIASRLVRIAPDNCKPCVVSTPVALSRDGTLAKFKQLTTPESLFLLRLTKDAPTGDTPQKGQGAAFGDGFANIRARMHATWGKHGTSGYWAFEPPDASHIYALPARFDGLF